MKRHLLLASALALFAGQALPDSHSHDHAEIEHTPAPDGAMVYFISPSDGETVTNPVTFRSWARGIGVAPAGRTGPIPGTITC